MRKSHSQIDFENVNFRESKLKPRHTAEEERNLIKFKFAFISFLFPCDIDTRLMALSVNENFSSPYIPF